MTPVRLDPAASRSRVKHSTTEPLRSPFQLSYKMLHISAGIHKILARIANMEDPDQTASLEAV